MVHHLIFISVNTYTKPTIMEGEYNVVNAMFFGIIPTCMQSGVSDFTKLLQGGEGNKWKQAFLACWQRVKGAMIMKSVAMVMSIGVLVAKYRIECIIKIEAYEAEKAQAGITAIAALLVLFLASSPSW